MRKPRHIRKDEFLALDIDIIDIVAIDDKAPAYTDKQVAVGAELFPNHIFHLPELEREHSRLVVGLHQVAVIPVRRDKHNLVWRNAHQVSRSGYDQILLQHDEAKVATSLDCKYRLFVEMYEIGLKMYEMVLFMSRVFHFATNLPQLVRLFLFFPKFGA